MKILYGITKSNFGGAQRYVFDLAIEAKKRGHQVAVLLGGRGLLSEKLEAEGVEVITLDALGRDISPLRDVQSFFHTLNVLHEWQPDVFHTNSSKMGLVGNLAARVTRVPHIIFTAHGWAFNESRPWYQKFVLKLIYWKIVLLSHKTICVSKKTLGDISGWPFISKKLKVVRNGIEPFEVKERTQARRELGVHEDGVLVVGTIAELHHIKGLDVLLRAWSKFHKESQTHLFIIGEGEERQHLENMASNLGISESVTFKGFVNNARSLLSAFDIFVLPSRSEAMPYAPLEAGVAGIPVISTSVGGVPEIIESGITGALIPKEDSEALLSSLILFHENPRMRDRLGKDLKKVVEEKFSRQVILDETFNIYQ